MRQQHLIGSVLMLLAIATAADVVPANGTTASALEGTKLPSYVKVMLAFDGIDQDYYNQNYRLGARLAVIFASGMEANKSSVVNVANGGYDAAVAAAMLAAKGRQAPLKSSAAVGAHNATQPPAANLTNSIGQTAAQAVQTTTAPSGAHAQGPVPVKQGTAAAPTPTYTPAPLNGMQKWLAGIVAPSLTTGLRRARSESNRKLLSWRSLLAPADSDQTAAASGEVPVNVEVTRGELVDVPTEAATEQLPPLPADDDDAPAPKDDAEFEQNPSEAILVPIESQSQPLQALGEFAIITDNPEEVRRKLLATTSNFGLAFYALLHKFGVAQKPSLFLDGAPVLGPAAEALNPAAYAAAATAAGLNDDARDMQQPQEPQEPQQEPVKKSLPPVDDSLPDARDPEIIVPDVTGSRRAKVISIAPRGFVPTVVRSRDEAPEPPSNARQTKDGAPIWVVAPLATLAALLGVVLIVAATMVIMRLVRNCRSISASRRHTSDDGSQGSHDSEAGSEEVFGDELIKHEKGGYLPTARAIEKLNATHQEISVTVEDIDHHSMLTQATTITSLQTGVTAAATGLTNSQYSDSQASNKMEKPIVSGIKVPSQRDLLMPSNDGSAVSAPASITTAAAAEPSAPARTHAAAAPAATTIPSPAAPSVLPGTNSGEATAAAAAAATPTGAVLQPPAGLVVRTRVQGSGSRKGAAGRRK